MGAVTFNSSFSSNIVEGGTQYEQMKKEVY